MTSNESAVLKLKAAWAILNETHGTTSDIQGVMSARESAIGVDGIWANMRAQRRFYGVIDSVRNQIDQAIGFIEEAERLDPEVVLFTDGGDEEIELTPLSMKSNAWFQHGLLSYANESLENARIHFAKSVGLVPIPPAQLFLAYTIGFLGHREHAILAFEKVIEMDPASEEAVTATRELSSLRAMQPKSRQTALWLSVFGGYVGLDRFYLGYIGDGFKKLITVGACGIWWLLDVLRISTGKMHDSNGMKLE